METAPHYAWPSTFSATIMPVFYQQNCIIESNCKVLTAGLLAAGHAPCSLKDWGVEDSSSGPASDLFRRGSQLIGGTDLESTLKTLKNLSPPLSEALVPRP